MSKASEDRARSFRWGQLCSGILLARDALLRVGHQSDLLSPADKQRLRDVEEILSGIEQRAWLAMEGKR